MTWKIHLFLFLTALFTFSCKTEVSNEENCGDGILDPGEDCDRSAFTVQSCTELGYYEQNGNITCNDDCTLNLSVCAFSCGDGLVQADHEEQCDGEAMPETMCAQISLGGGPLSCTATCRYDVSLCEESAVCGDGVIMEPFEQCDGMDLAGSTCIEQGYYGGQLACRSDDCQFDLSSCATFGACGDGTLQETYEACEGVNLAGSSCVDQGWFDGTLQCSATCEYDFSICQNIVSISLANLHGCILLSDGTVRCWGDNQASQLGFPGPGDSPTPLEVAGLSDVTSISAGYFHTCAILSDGTGRCWGGGTGGQLGDGSVGVVPTPVTVSGLNNIAVISAGYWQTCAVLTDGTARCWGFSGYGQLGDGSTEQRLTPVAVLGLTDAVDIGTGSYHSCALLASGGVKCWGYNESGQLGDGVQNHGNDCNNKDCSRVPVDVVGITNAVALAVGGDHTCVLLDDETVRCWGENSYGQLGLASTALSESFSPVAPSDSNQVQLGGIFAGSDHTCAIQYNDTLDCWGQNNSGQLGNGTTTSSHWPVTVGGLPSLSAVDAGSFHTCAVNYGHNLVYCWGRNTDGQLGDGTTTDSLIPVEIVR